MPRSFVRRAAGSSLALAALVGCRHAQVDSRPDKQTSEAQPAVSVASAPIVPPSVSAETTPSAATEAPNAAPPITPRVYARTRYVWIRPEPDASKEWIGYLWTGESVALKSEKPVYGPGCMEWYAVEPRGYVCVDGNRATLDANDPVFKAVQPYAAQLESPWPHQYGESTGLRMELTLPSDPLSLPALPITIHEPRNRLKRRSTVAFSKEVTVNGHDFLLTADFQWVPKESVTPYPVVKFQGVHLGAGKDAQLPLAFFKGADRPAYTRSSASEFVVASETFARLSFVELTGEQETAGKDRYLRTKRGALWIKDSDAVLPIPRAKTPWGADVGAPDTTNVAPKGRATWLEVGVMAGYLIAYEGTKPVFTTLISPGRGGFAKPGEDPIERALTPTGTFPVSGKFATATMEAPGEFIHSDVPWTQNFSGPHALHTAYWHDAWGEFKSGGCVNLSPIDGRTMFEFTEPALPPGWHGVRWLPWLGPSTLVVVHR